MHERKHLLSKSVLRQTLGRKGIVLLSPGQGCDIHACPATHRALCLWLVILGSHPGRAGKCLVWCVIILMHAAGSSLVSLNGRVQMEVPDTLLRSEFVTENAEETDYFFVDAWFYNARLSIVRDSKPS